MINSSFIRIAIISTHPIQYNAPLFRFLSNSAAFNIKVFYTWGENATHVYDPGFGQHRSWDIDLLTGYEHAFIKNNSKDPGSHHFKGIVNPDLIDQVEAFAPDAILVYGWNFHSHLQLMRHFKGKVPILFRGDSTLLDNQQDLPVRKIFRKILLTWVYRHVDHVLSPGTASDAYYKWGGLKTHQIQRAVHAIDNERFTGSSEHETKARQWRNELGIEPNKKVFLFAGKFEPKKDPLLLIEAFQSILKKQTGIHLIFVGDGILKSEIKNAKNNISDPASITLLDFQNQSMMPVVYRLADVFILPSKGPGETWGLAVNEAMACGKAVIVSDKCGCAQDLVNNDVNGYIFKSGDVLELCEAMENTLKNDAYKMMGEKSREIIKNYNYNSFVEALQSIIN